MVFKKNSERSLGNSMSSIDHSSNGGPMRRGPARATTSTLPRQTSVSFLGLSVARPNRYRQSSGGTRNSNRRLGADNVNSQHKPVKPKAAYRRYRVGENVLICCNSHWATLVNRHGFPPGDGTTADEQSGPYVYVFATVQTVHFDEFAEYYTVKRADTGGEQRADTGKCGRCIS
jgi:hypothetical protein